MDEWSFNGLSKAFLIR